MGQASWKGVNFEQAASRLDQGLERRFPSGR